MTGGCAVLVWINGAFGAGKTTLAEVLHERFPEALAFDPEYVGALLSKWAPDVVDDFQDIPLWRKLTADFAVGLCVDYRRPLIVPMTLVDTEYRAEVFDRITTAGVDVLHVFLDIPAEELRRRINAQVLAPDNPDHDAECRAFRLANVDRCLAARADLPPDVLVLRSDLSTPDQLADQVLHAIKALR